MSNRTTKHDDLSEDARWTRNRPPSGEIVCNGRPMAFWMPHGAVAAWATEAPSKDDIGLMDDSDEPEPGADDSGLGDDSPGTGG